MLWTTLSLIIKSNSSGKLLYFSDFFVKKENFSSTTTQVAILRKPFSQFTSITSSQLLSDCMSLDLTFQLEGFLTLRPHHLSQWTTSESHEADIAIRGLECQPKHFHMFSTARKTRWDQIGKASVKWDEKWQFTSPATINTLMAIFAGPLTVIMPVVKSV